MSEVNSPPKSETARLARRAWLVAVGVIVVLGFCLRASDYHSGYGHPDETITVEVVRHMRQSGDWDTNWAKAPTLEPDLRYGQYNFSSYLYATFGFYRLVKITPGTRAWRDEDAGFWVYRFFSVLLAALAVWQTVRLAGRGGGVAAGLGAGLLVAVAPLLVQDAHYARPEAFVTVLMLAAVALCWPRAEWRAAPVLGGAFVVGLLVACKVSMLLVAWLPFVAIAGSPTARRAMGRWVAGVALAVVVGFAVGAPGAVLHPHVYFGGIQHLMVQYAGMHPPHSHLGGGPVADMLGRYFVATLGWPVVAGAVVGAAALVARRRWGEFAMLAAPVLLFAGYFATRGVFFERNLSHVLPLFLILSAQGIVEGARWLAGAMRAPAWAIIGIVIAGCAFVPLRWSSALVTQEFSGRASARQNAVESSLRAPHAGLEWREIMLLTDAAMVELREHFATTQTPVLVRVTDFNDEWTAANLRLMLARFETVLLADEPGTFAGLPVSTLQTYHRPHYRYYLVKVFRSW